MVMPPPGTMPERPRAVGAASSLWVTLGGLLIVASGYGLLGGGPYGIRGYHPISLLMVAAIGTIFVTLGRALRTGANGVRGVLTVLGGLFSVFIWPLLFTVPAIVLQFRPAANSWFAAVRALRGPGAGAG
jgi:hypothetical protein